MADALPTHRLRFILISWSKKCQKKKFTHFFKMADACLHIYLILYSFCRKKNKKNEKWLTLAYTFISFYTRF